MHAQARVWMHTYACIHVHTLGFFVVFIFKIIHFNSKKSYIFPKTLSLSQFQSDQVLNQPWVLGLDGSPFFFGGFTHLSVILI